ncbi:MAG: biopolymer transporter ExbD [Pseudomonadota bacterium]
MRKRARHADEAGDVNVTPLLDIVFIMLIFFIVTATFIREKGIDVSTPDNTPQDEDKPPPPSMVLSVLENGLVQVNLGRTIDPLSVKNTVAEFLAANQKGVVLVSASPESASGVAVVVMDQARQAGATGRLSLTLQSEE